MANLFSVALRLGATAFTFAASLIIAWRLGLAESGPFFVTLGVVQLCAVVFALGYPEHCLRLLARTDDADTLEYS